MTSAIPTSKIMIMINIGLIILWCSFGNSSVYSFTISQHQPTRISLLQYGRSITATTTTTSSTQLFFFGNGPKDDGSPGDYVCKVRHSVHFQPIFGKYQSFHFVFKIYLCLHCVNAHVHKFKNHTTGLWLCLYERSGRVGRAT